MTCYGDHVRKTYRPLPAVPCVVGLVGCKGCVVCLESPYVGRLGSPSVHRLVFTGPLLHRAPVGGLLLLLLLVVVKKYYFD